MSRGELLLELSLFLAVGQGVAQVPVTIAVRPGSSGTAAIPTSFLGLSFETGSLTSSSGFPAESPIFQRLVSQIGSGWLRFGGSSVDRTGWVRGPRTSSTPSSVLTSSDVDRVLGFARATGWRVLWGLNLGTGTAATDADEANYVFQNGSDVVSGFEIGNEPDLYAGNGNRPSGYTVSTFLSEWGAFAKAIQAETPGAVLTGPGNAANIGSWTAPFAQQYGSRVAQLTQHFYPLAPVNVVGGAASNAATISNLMGGSSYNGAVAEGSSMLALAQRAGVPWRMSETNSCYSGGQSGVSDVFASALWAADYMFLLASQSAAGVNFHGGSTVAYTPIAVSGSSIAVRPLYYGLLLFQAASPGALIPVTLNSNGVDLTAYAVQDKSGGLRVAVLNKDASQNASVQITPGVGYTRAQAMVLGAPSLTATAGITLGGTPVAADGSWSPGAINLLKTSGGVFTAAVPAGSAVLVAFGGGPAGIGNSAGGKPLVAPDSMASVYGQNLAFVTRQAASVPLPSMVAGVTATVTDAAGVARTAPLIFVSPSQVNLIIPAGTASGTASVTVGGASGTVAVSNVAPGLFGMGGTTVAAATALRYPANGGPPTGVPLFSCPSACQTLPVSTDSQSTIYLSLYGTGIRGASSLGAVTATIGGIATPVQYAGPQGQYAGLDQVNIMLTPQMRAMGLVNVVLTVDGQTSNAVQIDLE